MASSSNGDALNEEQLDNVAGGGTLLPVFLKYGAKYALSLRSIPKYSKNR